MAGNKNGKQTEEREAKLWFAWMMRHELLASCGMTLTLGLVIGGACALVERFLV